MHRDRLHRAILITANQFITDSATTWESRQGRQALPSLIAGGVGDAPAWQVHGCGHVCPVYVRPVHGATEGFERLSV
jgi:hypothetical protein